MRRTSLMLDDCFENQGFAIMEIHYPKSVEEIPPERREEIEKELIHFMRFSPCERLRYVEEEWIAFRDYIKKFGDSWNRKSS